MLDPIIPVEYWDHQHQNCVDVVLQYQGLVDISIFLSIPKQSEELPTPLGSDGVLSSDDVETSQDPLPNDHGSGSPLINKSPEESSITLKAHAEESVSGPQ